MKALMHAECGTIVSPPADGTWALCQCGGSAGRWTDPDAGTFEVAQREGRTARILGIHNGYLRGGMREDVILSDLGWRNLWASERAKTPDNFLFVRRESPLVVIAPGESGDTSWVPWESVTDPDAGEPHPVEPFPPVRPSPSKSEERP